MLNNLLNSSSIGIMIMVNNSGVMGTYECSPDLSRLKIESLTKVHHHNTPSALSELWMIWSPRAT
jgi:hypothetical protein